MVDEESENKEKGKSMECFALCHPKLSLTTIASPEVIAKDGFSFRVYWSDGVTPDGTKILKLSKKFSCVKYPCTIILIEKKMFKISHFSVHIDAAYHIVCRLF